MLQSHFGLSALISVRRQDDCGMIPNTCRLLLFFNHQKKSDEDVGFGVNKPEALQDFHLNVRMDGGKHQLRLG